MKTLIIFVLIAVIGLAVLGAGPDSFINNVEAGGVFLLSGINSDSDIIVKEIEKKLTPNTETVEKGTFSLSEIIDNSTKLLSDDTDNMTKEKQAEMEVHRLINLEREKHGLKTLGYDEELASIAKSHSIDMANSEYFSHNTPEGLDPTDRASKADFVCRYQIGNLIYSGIGENIHMVKGSSVALWSSPESIAELAVSGWMDSPGHKKNILTSNFSNEGIGVSISTFTIHVTQNFC
jgi:uncharacterized protein YkwD